MPFFAVDRDHAVVYTACPDGVNQVKEGARRGDGDDPDDDEDRTEVAQVGVTSRVRFFQRGIVKLPRRGVGCMPDTLSFPERERDQLASNPIE